jgi:tripartite-type tricarboxylate transporter receptor subunit TctC
MIQRLIAPALLAMAVVAPQPAAARDYPARPVHWIVAFPAGGSNDIVARVIAQALSERLGQQFIIENKSGAGGNIGTEAALRAPADGYTLLFVAPHNAINATLYPKLSFDFLKDSAPVAGIARTPNVMEVHPAVPAKTVAEFIDYAKAHPGKINMASPGNGTAIHLAGELFMAMTGVKLLHVPYRGGAPALTDMLSGQVQVMFDSLPSSIGHIQSGALRALAVTTDQKSEALPGVPTIAETVPGYEASVWYGMVAPKGTPPDVIETLNKAINAILADHQIDKRLAELGCTPMAMTPSDFGLLLAAETEKWAKVVKFSGATPD